MVDHLTVIRTMILISEKIFHGYHGNKPWKQFHMLELRKSRILWHKTNKKIVFIYIEFDNILSDMLFDNDL